MGRCPWSPPVTCTLGPEGLAGKDTAEAGRPSAVAPGEADSEVPSLTLIIYSHCNQRACIPDGSPGKRCLPCEESHNLWQLEV